MPDNRLATEVSETKNYSTLKIKFDCGLNDDGKTIVKSRSYSNVKATAKALDVFNVAETLISLQQHDKLSIVKQDNTELN
jgi:hypothetical protein